MEKTLQERHDAIKRSIETLSGDNTRSHQFTKQDLDRDHKKMASTHRDEVRCRNSASSSRSRASFSVRKHRISRHSSSGLGREISTFRSEDWECTDEQSTEILCYQGTGRGERSENCENRRRCNCCNRREATSMEGLKYFKNSIGGFIPNNDTAIAYIDKVKIESGDAKELRALAEHLIAMSEVLGGSND